MLRGKLVLLFLFVSLLYYIFLIIKSSFVIDGQLYFVLFDDMMISMRYASNFSDGIGLVWNQGERVEGFSNLLWTIYMSIIHNFPIARPFTSLLIQLTGVLYLLLSIILVGRIAEKISNNSRFVIWTSLIFTAFYFPLVYWSTVFGTEVAPLALIILIVCYLIMNHQKNLLLIFVSLFIGFLIRMDFMVFVSIIFGYLLLVERYKREVLGGAFLFILGILAYEAWRYNYYLEFLPNTYYLKATGYPFFMRILRGSYVLTGLMNEILFLIVLFGVIIAKNRYISLFLAIFIAQVLYSIFVGGDAWEYFGGANRYIAIAMPPFFIAFSYSLFRARLLIKQSFRKSSLFKFLVFVFLLASFVSFNSRSDNMLLNAFMVRSLVVNEEGRNGVLMSKVLKKVTKPSAIIAVTTAGTLPYFLSDRVYVDMLGKNDKVIARERAHVANLPGLKNFTFFRPGHVKWNNDYSIGELEPDVIVSILSYDDAIKYLEKDYIMASYREINFYVKKGSKAIRWEFINYSK